MFPVEPVESKDSLFLTLEPEIRELPALGDEVFD
jgi:hypothetical protein